MDFLVPIKSTITIDRGKKRKEKNIKKNLQNNSKNKNSKCVFLDSLLSESFPMLGITVHLTSLGCPPTPC